jgi:hypothetical protein
MYQIKLKSIQLNENAKPVFNQNFIDVHTNPQYELTLLDNWIRVKYGQSEPRYVPVHSISWMSPLKTEDMGPKETPKRGRKPKIKAVADEPAKQAV